MFLRRLSVSPSCWNVEFGRLIIASQFQRDFIIMRKFSIFSIFRRFFLPIEKWKSDFDRIRNYSERRFSTKKQRKVFGRIENFLDIVSQRKSRSFSSTRRSEKFSWRKTKFRKFFLEKKSKRWKICRVSFFQRPNEFSREKTFRRSFTLRRRKFSDWKSGKKLSLLDRNRTEERKFSGEEKSRRKKFLRAFGTWRSVGKREKFIFGRSEKSFAVDRQRKTRFQRAFANSSSFSHGNGISFEQNRKINERRRFSLFVSLVQSSENFSNVELRRFNRQRAHSPRETRFSLSNSSSRFNKRTNFVRMSFVSSSLLSVSIRFNFNRCRFVLFYSALCQ